MSERPTKAAPYWSLDSTAAWIQNRRHAPTKAVTDYSDNGQSSGYMLLHVRQGLAKASGHIADDLLLSNINWWDSVEKALRISGIAGELNEAIFDSETDQRRVFSTDQWSEMVTLRIPGKRRLGLTDGSKIFDIQFDSARVQEIWPGKRGPRTAIETVMDGNAFRLNERNRKDALESKIYEKIRSGIVPSDPIGWLEEARGKLIGPETALEIRTRAIRRAKANGLPAAEAWGRPGRKPGRKNR